MASFVGRRLSGCQWKVLLGLLTALALSSGCKGKRNAESLVKDGTREGAESAESGESGTDATTATQTSPGNALCVDGDDSDFVPSAGTPDIADVGPSQASLSLTESGVVLNCGSRLTNQQYRAYEAIKSCYRRAPLPAGTGAGWAGNVLGRPICTSVEAAVTPSVVRCTLAYYQGQENPVPVTARLILPCNVRRRGLISDHIYLGVCRMVGSTPFSRTTELLSWTDPWQSLDSFYCPNTGQNRPSDIPSATM